MKELCHSIIINICMYLYIKVFKTYSEEVISTEIYTEANNVSSLLKFLYMYIKIKMGKT